MRISLIVIGIVTLTSCVDYPDGEITCRELTSCPGDVFHDCRTNAQSGSTKLCYRVRASRESRDAGPNLPDAGSPRPDAGESNRSASCASGECRMLVGGLGGDTNNQLAGGMRLVGGGFERQRECARVQGQNVCLVGAVQ